MKSIKSFSAPNFFKPSNVCSTNRTSVGTLLHMITTIKTKTKMIARLDQSIHLLSKTNNTLVTLVTPLVNIIQLSHHPVKLQFLQQDFPVRTTCIFKRIFRSFVTICTNYPKNDSRTSYFIESIQRKLSFKFCLFPG